MALHRVDHLTVGVPDVASTGRFYSDFGLAVSEDGCSFSTVEGGEQLRLVHARLRRLVRAVFGCDDPDDVLRISAQLHRIGVPFTLDMTREGTPTACTARDDAARVEVVVRVSPRTVQRREPAPIYNGPGRFDRINARSAAVLRNGQVRPRRLGHFVLGTANYDASFAFFVHGLGFEVSDYIKDFGAFLRCSDDHHNLLIQRSPAPFLHHTSWQVEDVDEIGRGATHMLEANPERHVWGLGRHYAGSNFFWYLKDPSGTFAEYHSDMDCIPKDAQWTPETLEGARGLFSWGPPPPPSFLDPEDLADLMIAEHR